MRPEGLELTGKSCVLGIVDQPLWQEHPCYEKRLVDVEMINNAKPWQFSMHGPAVVSIAAGEEIGVAPQCKIVYRGIETWFGTRRKLINHAEALRSLKRYVEKGHRLDAISSSHSWRRHSSGAVQNNKLVAWFETNNIPVFLANDKMIDVCGRYGFALCRRKRRKVATNRICVPIDDRLLARWHSGDVTQNGTLYYLGRRGGYSWAVPFVAGLFMLAREVDPSHSRQAFDQALFVTARTVDYGYGLHLPVPDFMALEGKLMKDYLPVRIQRKRRGGASLCNALDHQK